MSFAELKKVAKDHTPSIKKYYVMSRAQLIERLLMTEVPEEFKVEKMTIQQLRSEAKNRNFQGIWKLSRGQLVDLLYPNTNQDNKDNNGRQKHNNPEDSKAK